MKRLLFTFSFVFLASYGMAQETLSLGQCLKMGIERNLNLKTYEGNVLKGKHNISENRSRLLPQINIGAALNVGLTREEITEALLHAAVYCGFPRALNATAVARGVFADLDEPGEAAGD